MIVTVTLNPLLERRLTYPSINLDSVNREGTLTVAAGGKGINVSRQLNALNIPSLALTFMGGHNGKLLKEVLEKEKINSAGIRTVSETREASILIDENGRKAYTFFSKDSVIREEEAEEFKQKLDKIIRNCEIVVFSGSSPHKSADSIFPFGIETANNYDKVSVCDTYGRHLAACIDKSPTILHNNFRELQSSYGKSLGTEEEIFSFLDFLYSKGIKQAYITNGRNDTYASNFDFHYKIKNAVVEETDPAGSGDSFTAGIVYGWYKDFTFDETITLASALGSVNACKFETSDVNFEETDKIKNQIKISPAGKKIKTIDVTPL